MAGRECKVHQSHFKLHQHPEERQKEKVGKTAHWLLHLCVSFLAPLFVLAFGWLYRHLL